MCERSEGLDEVRGEDVVASQNREGALLFGALVGEWPSNGAKHGRKQRR